MFQGCTAFNQPLDLWNTSNVIFMESMFEGCTSFNQCLNEWDVSNVEYMDTMFKGCTSLHQGFQNWDITFIEHNNMFQDCPLMNDSFPMCEQLPTHPHHEEEA